MKVCVTCQADVGGKRAFPVREDRVIGAIRAAKRALGVAQNNQLFVCEACLPKHMERRRSFEKTLLFAAVLAGIMLLVIVISPLLYGRFEAAAIFSGIVVACLIVAMPVLFKYVPAVEGVSASARAPAAAPQTPPRQPPPAAVPAGKAEGAPEAAGKPKPVPRRKRKREKK